MGEYYFKREQFYKDEKADQPEKDEQVLVPEQRVEGVFTVQEKRIPMGGNSFLVGIIFIKNLSSHQNQFNKLKATISLLEVVLV